MEDHPLENNKPLIPEENHSETISESPHISGLDFTNRIDLVKIKNGVSEIREQLGKVIVGQEEFIELLMVSILSNGHALIEGVPGVAKTITAILISRTMDVGFSRIKFTSDFIPPVISRTYEFVIK